MININLTRAQVCRVLDAVDDMIDQSKAVLGELTSDEDIDASKIYLKELREAHKTIQTQYRKQTHVHFKKYRPKSK